MSWSQSDLDKIWDKGKEVTGNDPAIWRKDVCGAWMKRVSYGNRDSQYGWEVDHIDPDGEDYLANLRPLQWENNVAKSDGKTECVVTANGTDNARIGQGSKSR